MPTQVISAKFNIHLARESEHSMSVRGACSDDYSRVRQIAVRVYVRTLFSGSRTKTFSYAYITVCGK